MTSTEQAKGQMAATATVTAANPLAAVIGQAKMDKVVFVKDHASNYHDAGWDVVTETMDDAQVAVVIGRARTMTGAVNAVREAVVEPWVRGLLESRPGEDDDEQLLIAQRFEAEREANWYDATARVRGEVNKVKPPRKYARPVLPQVVEIDLTEQAEGEQDAAEAYAAKVAEEAAVPVPVAETAAAVAGEPVKRRRAPRARKTA